MTFQKNAKQMAEKALYDSSATEEQDAQRRDMSAITGQLRMNRCDAQHV